MGFAEYVESLHGDQLALLDAAGIPLMALRDPEISIPYTRVSRLLALAAQNCGVPGFALGLGSRQGLELVGALGAWICLQPTVGSALDMLQRNFVFHARGLLLELRIQGDAVALEMRWMAPELAECRHLVSLGMAALGRGVAQIHCSALKPLRAELTLPKPTDAGELRTWKQALGVSPVFGQGVNRIIYPKALLDLPVRIDETVREQLNGQWRGQWRGQLQPLSLPDQVERAITSLLPTGDCSLESVAQLVELQVRTLQAQLQQNELSFGGLLRRVRERLAREYLMNTDISLGDLALNLGFSELAVFSRAFKDWTGLSPRAWRSQASGAAL